MKQVRCKMHCTSTTQIGSGENGTYAAEFTAVAGGSKENEEFFKWTPSGELSLSVLKNQYFEPGKDYYIDITLAE